MQSPARVSLSEFVGWHDGGVRVEAQDATVLLPTDDTWILNLPRVGIEDLAADSELWTLPNSLVAPHIAGGTQFEGKYVLDIFTENLARFLRNETPMRNQVNKQAGF